MSQISEGSLLWEPSRSVKKEANLSSYMRWLAHHHALSFQDYQDLWQWSVTNIERFWQTIWDYFEVKASRSPEQILRAREMPGAEWFNGVRLNYAENIFDKMSEDRPAIIFAAEDKPLVEISYDEVYRKTKALANSLRELGVGKGDRVVAFMPHIPETIIALLAAASLGAVWSSCSPDFGSRSVLDRFQQIEPKILLAVDGYRYGGKTHSRLEVIAELQDGLPTLEKTIIVPLLAGGLRVEQLQDSVGWDDLVKSVSSSNRMSFEQVPFDHPLWVLYSSGTTGLPKPIVHGHGGILLEHLKEVSLHLDLGPGDRFFWYTSTGWMMWNLLIGGLIAGATIVVYDGSPGFPSLDALWKLAEKTGMTYFGTSAAFVSACMKSGLKPNASHELGAIRALGSTGSPLSVAGFEWIYNNVNQDLALESLSGGTDLCTAFVGGCRLRPVYAGEIQAAALGAKVQAFNSAGEPVTGEVGEMVLTEPMPSMPIYFWDDPGNERYLASYFEMYPGVWRHGDWIKFKENGGCVIYGRSDSTINRQGIRMGTGEIYQAVESLPEIMDSLVIDLEMLGRESFLAMFVVLADGLVLDEGLSNRIKNKIRQDISPRHAPNQIIAIQEVPYTLSGKKMEVPIRRVLLGQPIEDAVNPGAMRNPIALQPFIELSAREGVGLTLDGD